MRLAILVLSTLLSSFLALGLPGEPARPAACKLSETHSAKFVLNEMPQRVMFSSDGAAYYSGGAAGHILTGHTTADGKEFFRIGGEHGGLSAVNAYSHSAKHAVVLTAQGVPGPSPLGTDPAQESHSVLRLWDAKTSRLSKHLPFLKHKLTCMAVSPDGETVALGFDDMSLQFVDIAACKSLGDVKLPPDPEPGPDDSKDPSLPVRVQFFPDSKRVLLTTLSAVRILDRATGKSSLVPLPKQLPGVRAARNRFHSQAVSADGNWFAVGSEQYPRLPKGHQLHDQYAFVDKRNDQAADYAAFVWNANTMKVTKLICPGGAGVVMFHPDNRHLFVANRNGFLHSDHCKIACWDLQTMKKRFEWTMPHRINDVALSPCGRKMATSHDDCTLRLWSFDLSEK